MFSPNRVQQVSAWWICPVCYCEFGWSLASLFSSFLFFFLPFSFSNDKFWHPDTSVSSVRSPTRKVWRWCQSVLTASCCPGWPSSRPTRTGVVSGTGWWVDARCGRRWTGCAPTLAWAPLLIRRYGRHKHCVRDNLHMCHCFTQPRPAAHTPLTAVLKAANEASKLMYANNYTHMTLQTGLCNAPLFTFVSLAPFLPFPFNLWNTLFM